MAINHLLVDLVPEKFPFLARTVERNVLFPSSDRQDSKVAPSWLENYWPLSHDKQAAIVCESGFMEDLPASLIAELTAGAVEAFGTQYTSYQSTVVATDTLVATFIGSSWSVHATLTSANPISVSSLKGVTYLHKEGVELQTYAAPVGAVVEFEDIENVTTSGIDFTQMISSCAAISYLIATDGTSVYWSSPLNPIYWAPGGIGDDAGAGASKILAVSGTIRFVRETPDGFYVFSTDNIVRARYTNNADNPWTFKEVRSSSGTFQANAVASDTNLGTIFAWSDHGLSAISDLQAKHIFPDITEFLAGSVYEEFDTVTNTVTTTTNAVLDFSINMVAGRYLTVSYGLDGAERTFMLVFDIQLGVWAKFKMDHAAVISLGATTILTDLTFADWTDAFADTTQTFATMGQSEATSLVRAMTLGVITSTGELKRLSPVDIFTLDRGITTKVLDYEVLDNIIAFADTKLTRNKDTELSTVELFYTYPAFPDVANPTTTENVQYSQTSTSIQGHSAEDPTVRSFQLADATDNQEEYVERVIGSKITWAAKNTSSLQGIELGLIQSGRRR